MTTTKTPEQKFNALITKLTAKGFKIEIHQFGGQVAQVVEGQWKGYCVARLDGGFYPNKRFCSNSIQP